MSHQAYSAPVLVNNNETIVFLERIQFNNTSPYQYNEEWLQAFLFQNYSSIPFSKIDTAYGRIVPVCRELNTTAGQIDVLYVTPEGKLVVLEAKLWRNPEARRKVVAQILDYAKELNKWGYEDLQREVSRTTGIKGNALYEIIKKRFPDTNEADFVDEVSRSLKKGEFLLMIVGDGITEGTRNIAEFMQTIGRLQFSFGLVEVALYQLPDKSLLVQPRVLAKTVIIERTVIELRNGEMDVSEPKNIEADEEINEDKEFYREFWREFVDQSRLDDVVVPMSNKPSAQNLYLYPASNKLSWISAYFAGTKGRIGVYFRVPKGEYGEQLFEFLKLHNEKIFAELGNTVSWEDRGAGQAKYLFTRKNIDDIKASRNRAEIIEFFNTNINNFINVIRPLLKEFEASL